MGIDKVWDTVKQGIHKDIKYVKSRGADSKHVADFEEWEKSQKQYRKKLWRAECQAVQCDGLRE